MKYFIKILMGKLILTIYEEIHLFESSFSTLFTNGVIILITFELGSEETFEFNFPDLQHFSK
jgi:hypothetical protein